MELTVIIPAFNESKRIEKTLSLIGNFLSSKDYLWEVIVVDDGSTDDTVKICKSHRMFADGKLCIIKNWVNMGKGFSIKRGVLASSGLYILFTDADLSAPIEDSDKLINEMEFGYDIAIGSRSLADSKIMVHQPWHREVMGKMFNLLVKTFLLCDFNDTQCGFKMFKSNVAKKIVQKQKIDGFCFDVELLYIAKKLGYKIREVSVRWNNSPQSRVKIFRDSFKMFLDIFTIRRNHSKIN